jgi:quercetin dioxygenase-like cupin family protein
MNRILLFSAAAVLAASATGAQAKGTKWMDGTAVGLPKGSQVAVVKGDPTKAGDFIVHLKFPADFAVPPHSHPGDEVVRIVTGGPLHYGMGDKLVMANAGTLEKGYHVTMQAGMNHWAHAPVATVVQVSGKGPFGITYANPADDPRTAKK